MKKDSEEYFQNIEAKLQGFADLLNRTLPEDFCYSLMIIKQDYASYVSNMSREDLISMLRECADVLETHKDMPPGSSLEKH